MKKEQIECTHENVKPFSWLKCNTTNCISCGEVISRTTHKPNQF